MPDVLDAVPDVLDEGAAPEVDGGVPELELDADGDGDGEVVELDDGGVDPVVDPLDDPPAPLDELALGAASIVTGTTVQ